MKPVKKKRRPGAGRKKTHTELNTRVPLWVGAWLTQESAGRGVSLYHVAAEVLTEAATRAGADPLSLYRSL